MCINDNNVNKDFDEKIKSIDYKIMSYNKIIFRIVIVTYM